MGRNAAGRLEPARVLDGRGLLVVSIELIIADIGLRGDGLPGGSTGYYQRQYLFGFERVLLQLVVSDEKRKLNSDL